MTGKTSKTCDDLYDTFAFAREVEKLLKNTQKTMPQKISFQASYPTISFMKLNKTFNKDESMMINHALKKAHFSYKLTRTNVISKGSKMPSFLGQR